MIDPCARAARTRTLLFAAGARLTMRLLNPDASGRPSPWLPFLRRAQDRLWPERGQGLWLRDTPSKGSGLALGLLAKGLRLSAHPTLPRPAIRLVRFGRWGRPSMRRPMAWRTMPPARRTFPFLHAPRLDNPRRVTATVATTAAPLPVCYGCQPLGEIPRIHGCIRPSHRLPDDLAFCSRPNIRTLIHCPERRPFLAYRSTWASILAAGKMGGIGVGPKTT
jgi:hypothetical protein